LPSGWKPGSIFRPPVTFCQTPGVPGLPLLTLEERLEAILDIWLVLLKELAELDRRLDELAGMEELRRLEELA
jgi:hypothetical protein